MLLALLLTKQQKVTYTRLIYESLVFMHRKKPDKGLIFVSSEELQKNLAGYMNFPSSVAEGFIIDNSNPIYNYIYEKLDLFEPTGKTSVWEADL